MATIIALELAVPVFLMSPPVRSPMQSSIQQNDVFTSSLAMTASIITPVALLRSMVFTTPVQASTVYLASSLTRPTPILHQSPNSPLFISNLVHQRTDLLDLNANVTAVFQHDTWFTEETDSSGRAGQENRAGFEGRAL